MTPIDEARRNLAIAQGEIAGIKRGLNALYDALRDALQDKEKAQAEVDRLNPPVEQPCGHITKDPREEDREECPECVVLQADEDAREDAREQAR